MQAAIADSQPRFLRCRLSSTSTDHIQSGVYLRLCNASKELYASVQAIKEQGLRGTLADDQSRSEQLAQWVADPDREFIGQSWRAAGRSGRRRAALEAMQELFGDEPQHRDNAAGWDEICRNLVGIFDFGAGEGARTNAAITMRRWWWIAAGMKSSSVWAARGGALAAGH